MKRVIATLLIFAPIGVIASTQPPLASDAEIDAAERAPVTGMAKTMGWADTAQPMTLLGNIHYVGSRTASAWLITSPEGHILIDGAVPQAAPWILESIRALGYDPRDVRYLLNSHAHIDHAGGLASLKRATGATMVASAKDKPYLEAGDIGFGPSGGIKFPPVRVDRVIGDGEQVKLGPLVLTAHLTPGHSPGCTSWSTMAVGEDKQRRRVFFHCSATVAGQSLVPEAYPGMIADFRSTFARVARMRADVFLANHSNFFDLDGKTDRFFGINGATGKNRNAFVDPGELQRFNSRMKADFEAELARQSAAK